MNTDPAPQSPQSPRWFAFTLVCFAYLATTTGESLLSPIYPVASDDLQLDLAGAGTAFFVLAFSIAVTNILGGVLLRWMVANRVLAVALSSTAAGGLIAATAGSTWQFLAAQVFIGSGAGLLYPAAIMSIGTFAGPHRRGFSMGIFGVFFSGGLTLAAGLAALGTRLDWRVSFFIGVGLAVAALVGVVPISDSPKSDASGPMFEGLRSVLGAPSVIGVVGGISQYATVSFFPVFAVSVWGLTESIAATSLAAGRVLSIPAKILAGWLADRAGPTQAARVIGLILGIAGVVWATVPVVGVALVFGVIFVAGVSGLFPLANTLAFEVAGRSGGALGAFRSLQLGAGALAGLLIGWTSNTVGLRPTVAVVALVPFVLVSLRPRREGLDPTR